MMDFDDDIQLTPVSDTTVRSAFSESEQIDFESNENRLDSFKAKRKPGRPKGSSSQKLKTLETLFSEPIVCTRRRANSAPNSSRLEMVAGLNNPTVTEFHRACQYGQVGLIETMLRKEKIEVDCRDSGMNTGLHEAAIYGQIEAIKLLLKLGANTRAENLLKEKPADLCKHPEALSLLHEFELMDTESKENDVLSACWKGRRRELKLFMQSEGSGFNVNVVDREGNSGLHYAAIWNNGEIARILLSGGINFELRNNAGNSALHIACRYSSADVAKALLDAGSDYKLKNHQGITPIELSNKSILRIFRRFARDKGIGDPQLLNATTIRRFVEVSEDDESRPNRLLPTSIRTTTGLSREEKKLRQMMAIFNKPSSQEINSVKRKRGRPPTSSAIVTDEEEEEDRESSSSPVRSFSKSVIHQSRSSIDPFYIDKSSGRTQLHKFAAKGKLDQVQKLLRLDKTLVNRRDNAGYTALHEASLNGQLDIVEELLHCGAKPNVFANNGDTPLHDAAENGHLQIVKFLLSNGADVFMQNKDGKRPSDVCYDENVKCLLVEETSRHKLTITKSGPKSHLSNSDSDNEVVDRTTNLHKSNGHRLAVRALSSLFDGKPVDLEYKEPLLQIHCGLDESQHSGWYFLASQIEDIFHRLSPNRKSRTSIPLSKTRHMSPEEIQILINSSVLDKFAGLKSYLECGFPMLVEKEAVMTEFERSGGSLVNIPVMYVDLPRLNHRIDVNNSKTEDKDTSREGALPPKLKMKYKQRRSLDNVS